MKILRFKYMNRYFKEGTKYYEKNSKDKLSLLRQKCRMKGPFSIRSGLLELSFFFNPDSAMLLLNRSQCRCCSENLASQREILRMFSHIC